MAEAAAIREAVNPDEVLFVLDAMIGQDAVATAQAFGEGVGFTGVVLTKLDGDARGGAALSVREVTGVPILFASTGEKLEDFDVFHPDRMAGRILGMGDVLSLIEQAEQVFDAQKAEEAAVKIGAGELTLEDFLEQMLAVRKMGPIGNLLGMLPGAGQMKDALAAVDDKQLDRLQAIIRGMTPQERADPKIINASRRLRIANGSGVTVSEVNQLVDRFFEARKMMSSMLGGMGIPGIGRKSATRKAKGAKGKKGKKGARGPTPPKVKSPFGPGMPGMPAGFPDLSQMPEGLNELPPGLADFDLSKLKFPGNPEKVAAPCACTCEVWGCPTRPRPNCGSSTAGSAWSRCQGPTPPLTVAGYCPDWSTRTATSGSAIPARSHSTKRSHRPRPNATSVRCCCVTAARRPTPAASTTMPTYPASSGPESISPDPSVTRRAFRVELEDESQLPAAVAEEARRGDGWIKLVGDWIDRSVGDLAPLWSDDVLKAAIETAHAHGARVTAHVFSEDALPGLINAGIDCIEHGTGLTDDTITLMLEHDTALVPTLINLENFPGIADAATRYPTYAAHMRDLYARSYRRIAAAREAGVPVYAGTDAGSMIKHGRIADEVEALKGIGMSATEALGAACWDARRWLGRPGLDHGASADLLCYSEDPRQGPEVLNHPDLVILRGKTFRP